MNLSWLRHHTCPEDAEEATLLIDVETETVPVTDEEGNLLYYCVEGQHVFSIDEDGKVATTVGTRSIQTEHETFATQSSLKEHTEAVASPIPTLDQLGLSTDPSLQSPLETAIPNTERSIRVAGAHLLGIVEDPAPLEAYSVNALYNRNKQVRAAAVRALGKVGSYESIATLVKSLNDSEWVVRAAAAETLGELGALAPPESLQIIASKDQQADVRAAAVLALSRLGERTPKEAIVAALQDPDWQVREIAALVLGTLGEQVSAHHLEAALHDIDEIVRDAAMQSLRRLRSLASEEHPNENSR